MKHLTLIRHAKSSWKPLGGGDAARPLNKRGKRDAKDMGRRLAAAEYMPDAILSSPAKRARGTARRLAKAIGYGKSRIEYDESIYHASVERLFHVVASLDDSLDHVAMVGHNPGFSELSNLLSQGRVGELPTCAVVRLQLSVASWQDVRSGCGTLLDFDYPKRTAEDDSTGED